MMRMRAAKIVIALFLFIVLAPPSVRGFFLHTSLPKIEGGAAASGLTAAVTLVRDPEGVPHIFAAKRARRWFGMGYAHAQDRLWQMEFQRRVGAGRLSEILGESAFDTDRLMRTLASRAPRSASRTRLDPETRAHLEAYSAGVNAFPGQCVDAACGFPRATREARAVEARDTMAVAAGDGLGPVGQLEDGAGTPSLAAKLGPERTNEFFRRIPAIRRGAPGLQGAVRGTLAPGRRDAGRVARRRGSGGSNSWGVDGAAP